MNLENLTAAQRQLRQNVRMFLMVATLAELQKELKVSEGFRAECVQELINEYEG